MNHLDKMKKAAALKYDEGNDIAPKLTANGKGFVADNIIKKASENNVPILEDPTLVELLSQINVNETIPEDLYQVVAEVFAFIYQSDKLIEKIDN